MAGLLGDGMADIVTCLRFFSRLPVPARVRDRPFGEAIRLLPVAALLVAGGAALPYGIAAALGLPHGMAAVAGVAGGLIASGGLHEDGLADTADGFGGGRTAERKLAIMRDSRIGTYGVLALLVAVGWRAAALAALLERTASPGRAALLVLAAGTGTRALALLPLAMLPPARADGLGRGVGALGGVALAQCFTLAAAIAAGLPLLAGAGPAATALACVLAAAAALAVVRLAARQIGGHTGDVAGAAQQAGEAGYLLGLMLAIAP